MYVLARRTEVKFVPEHSLHSESVNVEADIVIIIIDVVGCETGLPYGSRYWNIVGTLLSSL